MDVTLSLWRWLEGRGLVKECSLKGVRGDIDRRHLVWDHDWVATRRHPTQGDFEIENFQLEDFLVSVKQPGGFRPYTISVFSAELPLLRRHWLMPQRLDFPEWAGNTDGKWSKMINSVPIDHLNHQSEGPLGWITSGKLDIDLHILLPQTQDTILTIVKDEIEDIKDLALEQLETIHQNMQSAHQDRFNIPHTKPEVQQRAPTAPVTPSISSYPVLHPLQHESQPEAPDEEEKKVVMYWVVKMVDVKAHLPLTTPTLTYLSQTLIRPIIAYLNANHTVMTIPFAVEMSLDNFNGASNYYEAGVADVLSREVGVGVVRAVGEERYVKSMGVWGLGWGVRGIGRFFELIYGAA